MDGVPQSRKGPAIDRTAEQGRELPRVGNVVSWSTLGGDKFRGRVVEMDGNIAFVLCDDGVRRTVEC